MLHCMSGRWWRRWSRAALGRGRARTPASPALTTLSGPRPPSRLRPVPRPRPVWPRCPLGWFKPVGQAAWGKLARLRQRRLCEGRGRRGCVQSVVWGPSLWGNYGSGGGVPSICRTICLGGEYGRTSGLEGQFLGAPPVLGVSLPGLLGVDSLLILGRKLWRCSAGRWVSQLSLGRIWGFLLCGCLQGKLRLHKESRADVGRSSSLCVWRGEESLRSVASFF